MLAFHKSKKKMKQKKKEEINFLKSEKENKRKNLRRKGEIRNPIFRVNLFNMF